MAPGLHVSQPLSPLLWGPQLCQALHTGVRGLRGQDSGSGLPGFGSCLLHLLPVLETLAKLSDPSVPQLAHLQNGNNNSDVLLVLLG